MLALEVGGCRFDVDISDRALLERVARRYAGFEGSTGDGVAIVAREARPALRFSQRRVTHRGRRIDIDSLAYVDRARRRGELPLHASMVGLDMLIRAEVTLAAHDAGGLVLHASAVEVGGRAHVFIGPSGAGKSTLARMVAAEGLRVLSDEMVVVRPSAGGFDALGTPFRFGTQAPAPIAGLWRLRHGPLGVTRLRRPELLKHIVTNLTLCVDDDDLAGRALAVAPLLAAVIPARELTFGLSDRLRAVLAGCR